MKLSLLVVVLLLVSFASGDKDQHDRKIEKRDAVVVYHSSVKVIGFVSSVMGVYHSISAKLDATEPEETRGT